jgi:hypothetical protein
MKYLVLIIMLFSLEVSAVDTIKIELKNHNNNLVLNLMNISQKEILINKRFTIGSSVDPCEVELIIADKNGQSFAFAPMVNIRPITDTALILLKPGEFIEKEYKIKRLILDYELVAGHYSVKAIYKNKYWEDKGVFSDTLKSNSVNIEVTEIDVKNSMKQ